MNTQPQQQPTPEQLQMLQQMAQSRSTPTQQQMMQGPQMMAEMVAGGPMAAYEMYQNPSMANAFQLAAGAVGGGLAGYGLKRALPYLKKLQQHLRRVGLQNKYNDLDPRPWTTRTKGEKMAENEGQTLAGLRKNMPPDDSPPMRTTQQFSQWAEDKNAVLMRRAIQDMKTDMIRQQIMQHKPPGAN